MYNNAHLISERYEDIATGKLQSLSILTTPLRFDDSSAREAFEYLQYKQLILPETRVINLHLCRRQYGSMFITYHRPIFESRTL